jgi:hypothetical protein
MELTVYDHLGNRIGTANNFGEAKKLQEAALPDELKECYAGLTTGEFLSGGMAYPAYYTEMLPTDILKELDRLERDDNPRNVGEVWKKLREQKA